MTLTKLKKPVEAQAYTFLPKHLCANESYESDKEIFIYKNITDAMNEDEIPEEMIPAWFQLMAVQYDDGVYAENFIDDKFPEEVRIKAFELFEIDEDTESNSYNLDTVYKALTDDNPKIRTAILRNESLKNLNRHYKNALKIASHDEDTSVKAFALEELSKL